MMNSVLKRLSRWLPLLQFRGSTEYWRKRYRLGGDSGEGSSGAAAAYKAAVLNGFVSKHKVGTVIEFGCGDGRQLEYGHYPNYIGVDISLDALEMCRDRFAEDVSKKFITIEDYRGETAELAMSIDVIFHLVEDAVYEEYLKMLFSSGEQFVIIYSTDEVFHGATMKHVRHRNVSNDVAERFPSFQRMLEEEAMLPTPVEFNQGLGTLFLIYKNIVAP